MDKNDIVTLTVEGYTSDGSGVGRTGGLAVFVPGACRGDVLRVRLVKCKKSYAYGRIEKILTASPHRVAPYCTAAAVCGGCQIAHISYPEQLALKHQLVADALSRLGGFSLAEEPDGSGVQVRPVLGMEQPLHYRNKMIFPIGRDKSGRTVGGFYRPRSHDIIPLTDCPIGDAYASGCLRAVLAYMEQYSVPPYDEAAHTGTVRRVMVRTARMTGEAMVVVSANADALPHTNALVALLRCVQGAYRTESIVLNINRARTNAVLGDKNIPLFGKPIIRDVLCGLSFDISPHSFYQVNPRQTEVLYGMALSFAGLSGRETVVDLYCGIGTISLCAARQAGKVYGVEIVPQAVADARQNARQNAVHNAVFYEGDAAQLAQRLASEGVRPDVVLLDPPRKGADPQTLSAIAEMAPRRVVYVSCNPATLARDAQLLCGSGYRAVCVQPVDMFPGTAHVENVMLFEK